MTANLDSLIALKSSVAMNSPRSRFSSSLNVVMPFHFNALYRWLVNFLRVSEPLKLIKTSYLYVDPGVDVKEEEGKHEEEAFSMAIEEAIGGIYIKTQQSLWVSSGTNLSQRSEIETYRSEPSLDVGRVDMGSL